MSWWDDATSTVSDWWEDEGKSKATGEVYDGLGSVFDDATDSVSEWFGFDEEEKTKQDAAAIPNTNQQVVENAPVPSGAKKGFNWTAISAVVGGLGLAAKLLG
ncbi:hypothetical protein HF888_07780 [Bermanella marisrubri]|uniref:Uncharacterized protein n=1 Tax=Bermanella marisrubri TaxID=207949 RepID=Q1N4Q0_9GAMM|nr:hypothetical protein [Bermanella marisrubri]EAT13378.1 hypothetical protein RED65_01420 [Oceanobacter sp. RED65] [Bermanella marisrubri]QIZ84132.1 hypothetical protein HF888_07780 [Bermanella marisrubri]